MKSIFPVKPRYVCKCGWHCYLKEEEEYHRDGTCFQIKRLLSVIISRERSGVLDQAGLEVDGIVVLSQNEEEL